MKVVDSVRDIMATLWYEARPKCVVCHGEGGPVCPCCRQTYFMPEAVRCRRCGKLIPGDEVLCRDCLSGKGPRSLGCVTVLGHFDGGWRDFIHTVKYRRNPQLLTLVTREACRWARCHLPVPDIITAVPMHEDKTRERGFNQAQVLASLMAWHLVLPYRPLLRRERQSSSQMGLDRQARLRNLSGAFGLSRDVAPNDLRGRVCWLIDDVTTTGATLEHGARALLAGGAGEVYGFCLAAARIW